MGEIGFRIQEPGARNQKPVREPVEVARTPEQAVEWSRGLSGAVYCQAHRDVCECLFDVDELPGGIRYQVAVMMCGDAARRITGKWYRRE
jgi:hypothetical protein